MKIIAELCQNHGGDFKILSEMVEQAASSGATHVKLQHIYAKNLSKREVFENGIVIGKKILFITRPYKSEFIRLKPLELTEKQIKEFIKICKVNNVIPLTTCFTRSDIKEISELGFEEIKVASYDCSSFPMLSELKKIFKHVYLSTGASYNIEIKTASRILKKNFSLLHCITQYPTNTHNLNLARMDYLRQFTDNIGYSDHTNPAKDKLLASMASIYFGAKILERHFTILDKNKTRDGVVSVNPNELNQISNFSKLKKNEQLLILNKKKFNKKLLLGKTNPKFTDDELRNRDYYRGRFVSKIKDKRGSLDIYNWEETDLN